MLQKLLIQLTFIALLGYLFACAGAWMLQEHLIFHPNPTLSRTPADENLQFSDVWLTAENGERVHAWNIPATTGSAPYVLFFHGNAGNLGHRLYTFETLHRLGFNIFAVEYRGYGRSDGQPSVANAREDAELAWRYLTGAGQVSGERIVIYGRSLGGGVASALAAKHTAAALVLESTFSSLSAMGHARYPFLPVGLLLRDDLDSLATIQTVASPVLVAHSVTDRVVPYHQGKHLFDAAGENATWYELSGSHNRAFRKSGPAYHRFLAEFIGTATMRAPTP